MIMVTGANGQLGSGALAALRARGVPAIGGSRSGGDGRRLVDFDEPATLDFTGIDTLVLISAGYAEDDQVIARHAAAIDAAKRDGVAHLVYTSVTGAGDHLGFSLAHRATEEAVRRSGLNWTILRNGLYAELFGALLLWTDDGLESPFGDGALAAVTRTDLADATAVVAADASVHAGRTYELVGEPITADDIAQRLSVSHSTISLSRYRELLLSSTELLPFQPPMLASIATSVRHGFLQAVSDDLTHLLGRPIADPRTAAAETAASLRSS